MHSVKGRMTAMKKRSKRRLRIVVAVFCVTFLIAATVFTMIYMPGECSPFVELSAEQQLICSERFHENMSNPARPSFW